MYPTKPKSIPIELICIIGIIIFSAGLSSCSNQISSNKATNEYRFGNPIQNDTDAQTAAQSALRASFDYSEPLTIVKTEEMSYGEYAEQIGQPLNQSKDLEIWLILYYNREWKSNFIVTSIAYNDQGQISTVPSYAKTPPPPFRGCVYVAINAENGSPVEVGGPLGKNIVTECDK